MESHHTHLLHLKIKRQFLLDIHFFFCYSYGMTKTSDNGDGITSRSGSDVFFYFNIPTGTGGIFMDTGNTGFMMICTALVFIMTPGLAFFYGGAGTEEKCL